jgi:hypothetical protein
VSALVLEVRRARFAGRTVDLAADVLRLLPGAVFKAREVDVVQTAAVGPSTDKEEPVARHRCGGPVESVAVHRRAKILRGSPRVVRTCAAGDPDVKPAEPEPIRNYVETQIFMRPQRDMSFGQRAVARQVGDVKEVERFPD